LAPWTIPHLHASPPSRFSVSPPGWLAPKMICHLDALTPHDGQLAPSSNNRQKISLKAVVKVLLSVTE